MPYLVRPIDTPLYYVEASDLAAYLAAGYTQASAAQIAAYHAVDIYGGRQTAPPAPRLPTGKISPSSDPSHVH